MESIVTTIAEKVAQPIIDYTVAPIARQVGYLIFYKDNFKNLNDQVAELKGVKDTISHEVNEERRNGRQIYDAVQNWLDRVDEIIETAEKLSDDPRHRNVGCCKGPFPDLKSRHQLSRKATKIAGNIVEVMQGKDNIGPLAFLPELEGVGSTCGTSSEKLESRKKMKEDIVLALKDPNLSRIGVYGLGGVGKTTLVKEIAKQVKDDKLFDEVVMVNISQVVDLERIQHEIADLLGLHHFEETSLVGKASRLSQRIKIEKSILVILDDIWAILELDKLGIPLNDHKGCKLLLTSRNLDILQKMETQKDFLIDVLNKAEAWILFEDMVGDVVKDVSLHDVAIQVAQKCAGLIVLIVTVARALKNKYNIDSWKDALNQLKTVDKEGMNKKIYSALEFSYNHLEGDDVKELFMLCGLLGPRIDVGDLFNYGMGMGIFKQIDSPKDARLKLRRLIDSLKASCLLLEDNSNGKVKMHDTVHEVAVAIASRDQHVCKIAKIDELKKWQSEEFLQRCTQIIIKWCNIPKLPERLECPNLKCFCLNNVNESLIVPDSFFEGMKNLKVLDLTQMHLPSLPQSFHSLINLQTLCLYHCALGDMTNIGALSNLKILCLYGSSMITFPSELGNLTHLKMLDLTDSGIEIFPSNIISKLTELEEVYLGNTSIKWDQEDSIEQNKNASLTELRHLKNLTALEIQIRGAWVLPRDILFDKLERYKIVVGDVWEWSDNYGASKMLKLKLGTVIHLEHGIKELIKGVEDLYLDEVNGISSVLYDLNGEGFPLLKHLHIQNNGKIQHIINSMERKKGHSFFPKLETLVLQNLNILEKICHGSFMDNSFANLRFVKVKCCDQLKYLFSVLMVKALCQLVEIEVSECSSMNKIVFVENSFPNSVTVDDNIEFCSLRSLTLRYLPAIEDFYSSFLMPSTSSKQSLSSYTNVPSSFFNAKVKFSTLKTLKLSSIHLENIWQDDHLSVANSFHKLANLNVEECGGLKYLFSSSMVGCFSNLQELEIRDCDMMEQIIGPEGRNGIAIEEVGLPKLENVVISNMKRLKKVWHFQFEGLKTLEVNNCEKLENIFPSDMQTTFQRMETLKVSDCGSVKEIFELPANEINSEEDTQLKKLHLFHLPKLKQIWSKDPQGDFRFYNLQGVHVVDCVNLKYLFPFSIALDLHQLEELKVHSCGQMNEIVAKKEGPTKEKALFHFDRLYSLDIQDMHQLDRFHGGTHSLTCPSLRILRVFNCAKLKLLGRQSTSNHRNSAYDQNPHLSTQQPLFIIEEVIPKLEQWTINNKDAIMMSQDPQWKDHYLSNLKILRLCNFEDKAATTFLYSIVQKAPNLTSLVVRDSSLKEIFQDKKAAYKEGKNEIKTQLQKLSLIELQLQHICREGCQVDPILELLKALWVTECANLKILVPSSVAFSHLIYLEIEKCNGLINLIYLSTATSLVNLRHIILKECNSLEEIVKQRMNETRDEIVFKSLRTLTLESLPRLSSFSSSHCFLRFPLLKRVVVRQCSRMKAFCEGTTSTPMLRKVIIKEGKDEEWCWEGDLIRTIKKIYVDKADQIVDTTKQEIPKLPSSSDDREQKENASSTDPQDAESQGSSIRTQEICETIKKPSISATQNVPSSTMIPNAGVDPSPLEALEVSTSSIQDEALQSQEIYENSVERPLVQSTKIAPGTTTVYDADESQDLQLHTSENLLIQTTTSIMDDDEETIGARVRHESIDKPFIDATKNAWDITIVQKKESHDSDVHLSKNLFNQTITSMAANYEETIRTKERYESKRRFSVHDAQNVLSPTMYDTAVDPAPSQASDATSSSTTPIAHVCSSFKEVSRLLPYLEAGVKRHPQVFDWFNIKRRRVLASSSFSLFAEVTRILRTTRRGHLTKDDRNYIRECCTVLEVVGFDASWLSYVYKCIEECGDVEDVKRKVEETKGQASNLEAQLESMKKELASVKESLVLLLDKASRLDDFIES